jgi:hypothetical protein
MYKMQKGSGMSAFRTVSILFARLGYVNWQRCRASTRFAEAFSAQQGTFDQSGESACESLLAPAVAPRLLGCLRKYSFLSRK